MTNDFNIFNRGKEKEELKNTTSNILGFKIGPKIM